MDNHLSFTFRYSNGKVPRYFTIGFILSFVLFIGISIWLLIAGIEWIMWLTVPLLIISLVTLGRSLKGKLGITDVITVDGDGFTSRSFGRIWFKDIDCIPPYNIWGPKPPSMRIQLKNGQTVRWLFGAAHISTAKDEAIFVAFREALFKALEGPSVSSAPGPFQTIPAAPLIKPPAQDLQDAPVRQAPSGQPSPMTAPGNDHREQLKKGLKRNRNRTLKYTAIPISLGFALIGFMRTCGKDYIQQKRAKEAAMLRQIPVRMEATYQDRLEKARKIAESFSARFGPVYVLSNDSDFFMRYLPDIQDSYQSKSIANVYGLRRTERNEKLAQYIKYPDSATYRLIMYHRPTGKIQPCRSYNKDSTLAPIYMIAYNPKKRIAANPFNPADTGKVALTYSSAIQIPKNRKITRDLIDNKRYATFRSTLIQYPGTLFYMIAATKDSVPRATFQQLSKIVLTDFQTHGLDTTRFDRFSFNHPLPADQ